MYLLHRKNIDIYANISLFLSYSVSQSVSGSDGGLAPGDDVCGPDCRWRPDEPRGHNPSEDLDLKYNKTKKKQIIKNIIKYLTTIMYIIILYILLEIATILK